LVLAPGGLGTMISLMISGRLVARVDQRLMLMGGCLLNAFAAALMTHLTLGMDYWSLAWPRFLQGFAMGFIFPPLQTLTLATIRLERLGNATAAYNVVRNIGGSIGVALATTLLVRRSQAHQTTLVSHLDVWDADTSARLKQWTAHFVSQGADSFTAGRGARKRSWPAPGTATSAVREGMRVRAASISSSEPNGSREPCANMVGAASFGRCDVLSSAGRPGGCSG